MNVFGRLERVYRSLLVVYPRHFRELFEDEMVELFRDRLRAALQRRGRYGGLVIVGRTLRDLGKSALLEHLERVGQRWRDRRLTKIRRVGRRQWHPCGGGRSADRREVLAGS